MTADIIASLRAELDEECRINGKGAEREAGLHGEIARLQHALALETLRADSAVSRAEEGERACREAMFRERKLVEALRQIADQDAVELALDPEWAQRIARAALAKAGR
jgi:hypothetical protein